MADFSIGWQQFSAGIVAVGALGVAAFGVVESFGKAFAFSTSLGKQRRLIHVGLPYVGLGVVRKMAIPLAPALRCAYGDNFAEIIANQYRSGRSQGSAPDTIRQGVRLGLPFLAFGEASTLIASVWHMEKARADALARALQAPTPANPAGGAPTTAPTEPTADDTELAALAPRFATALDTRVSAAFQLAEERYQTVAKTTAAVVALVMAGVFNYELGNTGGPSYSWPLTIVIGLVAVPLAPVAKDLSTSLQNALTAFKAISGKAS